MQCTLACDRQCNDPGRICGELAADTSLQPTVLAIGIDELSVSPAAVHILELLNPVPEKKAGK